MLYNVWIDDKRDMPRGFNKHCRTFKEAVDFLYNNEIGHVSFDHDLGGKYTGYDIAKLIEMWAYFGEIFPLTWSVHSANPVGKKNIESAMLSAERFWKRK